MQQNDDRDHTDRPSPTRTTRVSQSAHHANTPHSSGHGQFWLKTPFVRSSWDTPAHEERHTNLNSGRSGFWENTPYVRGTWVTPDVQPNHLRPLGSAQDSRRSPSLSQRQGDNLIAHSGPAAPASTTLASQQQHIELLEPETYDHQVYETTGENSLTPGRTAAVNAKPAKADKDWEQEQILCSVNKKLVTLCVAVQNHLSAEGAVAAIFRAWDDLCETFNQTYSRLHALRQPFKSAKRWHERQGWHLDLVLCFFVYHLVTLQRPIAALAGRRQIRLVTNSHDASNPQNIVLCPVGEHTEVETVDDSTHASVFDDSSRSQWESLRSLLQDAQYRRSKSHRTTWGSRLTDMERLGMPPEVVGPGGSVNILDEM